MIKDLLKQDFGMELDIAGGTGQSNSDPIYVLSQSEQDASLTEYLVLRGIGKGLGIHWRTISVSFVPGMKVIQRKIETKEVTVTEIITKVVNYYFLRKNLELDNEKINSRHIIYFDKEINIEFPYELSWLHYDGITDYSEQDRNDLGYSLAYGAPGIKATVYVYPKVHADTERDVLELELDSAIAEIKSTYGDDEIEHDWGGAVSEVDHIYYAYMPKHDSEESSLILIMMKGGGFVKLRYSFIDDGQFMRDIFNDFKNSFLTLMRRQTSKST